MVILGFGNEAYTNYLKFIILVSIYIFPENQQLIKYEANER